MTHDASPRGQSAGPTDADGSTTRPHRRVVSMVRAGANIATLAGAIVFAIGWAAHWHAYILGRVALVTLAAFVISFIAIVVENRTSDTQQPEDTS